MLTPLSLTVARGRVDKQNVVYGHTEEHSTTENGTPVYAARCDTTSAKVPPWNVIHKRQTHGQMTGLLLTGKRHHDLLEQRTMPWIGQHSKLGVSDLAMLSQPV